MPFTQLGKNLMLDALKGTNPTVPITHVGLLDADAGQAFTGETIDDTVDATAHGYSNGDLVVLTALTGGSGLVGGNASNANGLAKPYFVIAAAANTFQLAETPGGAAVDFGSDVTAGTVQRLVEISGGSPAYARVAIAYAAASGGQIDDSTNGAEINAPAGATVDYVGFYSALTAGSLLVVEREENDGETFAGQGTYTVNNATHNLNA